MARQFAIIEILDDEPTYDKILHHRISEPELRTRIERLVTRVVGSPMHKGFSDFYWRDVVLPELLEDESRRDEWNEWVEQFPQGIYSSKWELKMQEWLRKMPKERS